MVRRRSIPIKVISVVVLFFFCWTFGGLFDIAYAAKNEIKQAGKNKPKKEKPEEKFEKTLNDLEQALLDTETDTDTKKNKAKEKKSKIDALDVEIKKQFADTEKKLKDEGLPQEILERHYNFVNHYEKNLKELQKNLDDIEKAKTKAEADDAIDKTKKFLEKVKPPKKHVPLDPNKLPHRTPEPKFIEPRKNPNEFKTEQTAWWNINEKNSVLVASNGPLTGLLNSSLPNIYDQDPILLAQADPPTSADLAETIEVQFTPAIQAKAEELEHNPVKIYNWVRNNIEFAPTYGSIQGADYCLQTKLCNAFDTSSLLIALLRVSGIHARYVEGTVEIPIEKVKNWVGGFTDSMAALRLMASGGIPTKGMTVGGEIKYVRLEHIWVEAWIDYMPSRGARHNTGQGDTWIPLDTSFKQYTYTQGIDIESGVPIDMQSLIDHLESTATINEAEGYVTNVDSIYIEQTMQDYQTQVENYINQNYPDSTVGDILGKKEIIKQEFSYLLGTLPYKTIVKGSIYANIPDNLRHKISIHVLRNIHDEIIGTPINITKSLPELAGKKITLSYSPATQIDIDVINYYISQYSLPAYLVNIRPELMIGGEGVATGTELGLGSIETLKIIFSGPVLNANDVIINNIQAGEYLGIALNLGNISRKQLSSMRSKIEETKVKIENNDFTGMKKDDIFGQLLYTVALSYLAELDIIDFLNSKKMDIKAVRLPSEAVFSSILKVDTLFGTPMRTIADGFFMDVDRAISINESLDGDKNKVIQFILSSGMNSSALEHNVPELLLSTQDNPTDGISANKALMIANNQGIPIYTINQSNLSQVLPQLQLEAGVINDINNAVTAGKVVKVSKTNIDFNGWIGCGYIVINPLTGDGAYMISGGLSGARLKEAIKKLSNNMSLIPKEQNLDEIAEAVGVIWEEILLFLEIYKDLMGWHLDYLSCVISKLFVGTEIENVPNVVIIGFLGTMMAAAKIAVATVFTTTAIIAMIVAILFLSMSIILTFAIGWSCKDE
jgi:transglutaminase-like putative cysteine protease